MFTDGEIRENIRKARKFVNEHRTLTACAITAVITSKVTYSITTEHCVEKVTAYVTEAEQMKSALSVVTLQRDVLLDFVNDNDMKDEVINYIRDL